MIHPGSAVIIDGLLDFAFRLYKDGTINQAEYKEQLSRIVKAAVEDAINNRK